MDSELFNVVIKSLISVISVIVFYYIIPYLKANTDAKKWNEVLDFCEKCVEAAEKKYTQEEWAEKKHYVMTLVSNKVETLGISITIEEIDALIEGFVMAVKG